MKFVDDGTIVSKVNMVNGVVEVDGEGGVVWREKRDQQTENIFKRTIRRAESKGMKVNVNKTAMLAVSDSIAYRPRPYIQGTDGERIQAGEEEVRVLGFIFSSKPNVNAHVRHVVAKTRRRLWVLRHLKRFGFTNEELVKVYTCQVRSVIEYCAVVYNSMLSKENEEELERLQKQSLKCVYGFEHSYRHLLEITGLETLKTRRENACLKFARKCLASDRFAGWFPRRANERCLRNQNVFKEERARCDRLRNTPVFYMRRLLNEYGEGE
jgi:hypothetical protein